MNNSPRILDIGCGPARELIELLQENKITKRIFFDLFDHNASALDYVRENIAKIDSGKRNNILVQYFNGNYAGFIRKKHPKNLKCYDFIYCPGIFDYLTGRIATKFIESFYQMLKKDGVLIICNANKRFSNHRAYYEMIGEWAFIHREKEEILSWVKNIKNAKEIKFEDFAEENNYLYLSIAKQ